MGEQHDALMAELEMLQIAAREGDPHGEIHIRVKDAIEKAKLLVIPAQGGQSEPVAWQWMSPSGNGWHTYDHPEDPEVQKGLEEMGYKFRALVVAPAEISPAEPGQELSDLRQAIIDHTKGDLFWIGEILLNELEKETGFGSSRSPADSEQKAKAALAYLIDHITYQDSYGVQGSEFTCCRLCSGGGAPGVHFEHDETCPVLRCVAIGEEWWTEQRELDKELEQLRRPSQPEMVGRDDFMAAVEECWSHEPSYMADELFSKFEVRRK